MAQCRDTDAQAAVLELRAAGCVFAERELALLWERFPSTHERAHAIARRTAGEPLEYVVGRVEFAGVVVEIGPPAFVPRRRAEVLVDEADRHMAARGGRPGHEVVAVDLGCGCGAIAAALTSRHTDWAVHAVDVDAEALAYARVNGSRFGFAVHEGNWFAGLPPQLAGSCDLVVAHLPYVPTGELESLPRDFRDHEAVTAVDGGPDGLDPWRAVTEVATDWLSPGGVVLTHVAEHQLADALRIADEGGLVAQPTRAGGDEQVAVVSALRLAGGPEAMGQTLRP